jgi:hypothetical protein
MGHETRALQIQMGETDILAGAVLPSALVTLMEETRRKKPGIFGLSEDELLKVFTSEGYEPPHQATMLRIRFWDEFDRTEGRGMVSANIYNGVCPEPYFRHALKDPRALAWILCPLQSLVAEREADVRLAARRLRKLLTIDSVDKDGKVDKALARIQLELLMYYDQKISGGIVQVQKIEQHTTALNANVSAKVSSPVELDALREQLKNMSPEDRSKMIEDARKRAETKVIEVKAE